MAPKRATRSTRVPPVTPAPNATTTTVTEAQLQALINQGVAAAMAEAEASRLSKEGAPEKEKNVVRKFMQKERFKEEALVEFMVELFKEDEDGKKNEKDGLFNLKANDRSRKA
ncbi:hypothetical protein Tco_0339307 [Tanacetum coccineum]